MWSDVLSHLCESTWTRWLFNIFTYYSLFVIKNIAGFFGCLLGLGLRVVAESILGVMGVLDFLFVC